MRNAADDARFGYLYFSPPVLRNQGREKIEIGETCVVWPCPASYVRSLRHAHIAHYPRTAQVLMARNRQWSLAQVLMLARTGCSQRSRATPISPPGRTGGQPCHDPPQDMVFRVRCV